MNLNNINNIIIAKDRKNKTLKFSGIEDRHDILQEFTECMSRHNHSAVLSRYDYDEPVEPIESIRRLTGMSRTRPQPNDQRDLNDYKKTIQTLNASCSAVMG